MRDRRESGSKVKEDKEREKESRGGEGINMSPKVKVDDVLDELPSRDETSLDFAS